jgi:hypothetical protein
MKSINPPPGKILVHGREAGEVTDVDIERRASELAAIEQRIPTAEDRARARRELAGKGVPPGVTDDEPDSHIALTRDPSEPPSDTGARVPEGQPEDEEQASDRLVEEGVAEAQHDQMLAAQRKSRREDREI